MAVLTAKIRALVTSLQSRLLRSSLWYPTFLQLDNLARVLQFITQAENTAAPRSCGCPSTSPLETQEHHTCHIIPNFPIFTQSVKRAAWHCTGQVSQAKSPGGLLNAVIKNIFYVGTGRYSSSGDCWNKINSDYIHFTHRQLISRHLISPPGAHLLLPFVTLVVPTENFSGHASWMRLTWRFEFLEPIWTISHQKAIEL